MLIDGAKVRFSSGARAGDFNLGTNGKLYATGSYTFGQIDDPYVGAGYQHKLTQNVYGEKSNIATQFINNFDDTDAFAVGVSPALILPVSEKNGKGRPAGSPFSLRGSRHSRAMRYTIDALMTGKSAAGLDRQASAIDKRAIGDGAQSARWVSRATNRPTFGQRPDKAIHHYPRDHYQLVGRDDRRPCSAAGRRRVRRRYLDIGPDRARASATAITWSSALVEISGSRQPCWKLSPPIRHRDCRHRRQLSPRRLVLPWSSRMARSRRERRGTDGRQNAELERRACSPADRRGGRSADRRRCARSPRWICSPPTGARAKLLGRASRAAPVRRAAPAMRRRFHALGIGTMWSPSISGIGDDIVEDGG